MSGGSYIGQVPQSNFNPGRAGHWIHGIALHHTWTTLEGAIAHFLDPNAQVSAHEIVGRDGVPTFMLVPTDTAYADGLYEANLDYYAIEFVQSPTDVGFTPEQYAYGHKRALELSAQFGWVVGPDTLLPHHFWVATSCPGDLAIAQLITGGPAVPEQYVDRKANPVAGQVYDNGDRNYYDFNSVGIVNGSVGQVGQQLRWTEAKTVNGKWLLHVEGTSWALWDDCVDDTIQGTAEGHPNALAPSDFAAGPPPPTPVPSPSPVPAPVPPTPTPAPVPAVIDLQPVLDAIKALSDQVAGLAKHLGAP
jgi:hypothetical protein